MGCVGPNSKWKEVSYTEGREMKAFAKKYEGEKRTQLWCPLKSDGSRLCNKAECAWWVDECAVTIIMSSLQTIADQTTTLARVADELELG